MKSNKERLKIQLVVDDNECPMVRLEPGMKVQVEQVEIIGEGLKELKKLGARLCGGGGTCLACRSRS